MNKNISKIWLVLLLVISTVYYSCETTDLNMTQNPNELPLNAANPSLILSGAQLNFARMVHDYGVTGSEVARIRNMFGRNYNNAYGAAYFDTSWEFAYRDVIKNIRVMTPIAEDKGLRRHVGMGQVLEAYTIVTLVDFFGDIPYTEAFSETKLNPKLDTGASVYSAAIVLLDKSIANFTAATTGQPTVDLYYSGNWEKWIRLANTIKLKIYIQTRLVDPTAIAKFNTIIASGNYITSSADDFQFQWGTSNANPDSRHPEYVNNYTPSGVESGYQSNWLMDQMINKKSVIDPRTRFYFYRQVNDVPVNEQDIRCSIEPIPPHYVTFGTTFCRINNNNGYWGRDHGNNENIPNDRAKRTASGLYPAGGRFDGNNFVGIASDVLGAKGAGITPVILASSVDFWRAEAALSPGGSGDARMLTMNGIQKSIAKVRSFISRDPSANLAFVPALSVDATYLSNVGTQYDAEPAGAKLNVVMREFYISLYGQGIDAFNAYRRTGFPKDLQPNLEPNPGGFMRSFYYPASESGANSNVPQKPNVLTRVFWDTNPLSGFLTSN